MLRTLVALSLLSWGTVLRAAEVSVVPAPAKLETLSGTFRLTSRTAILADPAFAGEAKLLGERLQLSTSARSGRTKVPRPAVRLVKSPPRLAGAEAYSLEVAPEQVKLCAISPAGMFRATQTLLQLLPVAAVGGVRVTGVAWSVPAVRIEDAPRFQWRGLMLDCSRTFQSVEYLKQTLDRMALYKLNVLHLHLTDDQGWRLEIRHYPQLTLNGSSFPAKYNEPPSHEGFYTQEQMRDLVAYAAARHITVVPEIEMPGHSTALLSVMPELSCRGQAIEIFPFFKGPGVTPDILCAGREETFLVLSNILNEVIEVFPSRVIHIGGDEAPKERWKECARCQKRLKDEGLKNEAELQGWFNRRIEKMLAAKGRRLIGWDEILEGGLSPEATVMSWRGVAVGVHAAKAGHDVVMSPTSHCYFDYPYKSIDTAKAFAFDPVAGIPADQARHVLGLQANFWSHIDREPELVDRQLFPRLLALAERGWSPDNRSDWQSFEARARAQLPRLAALGVHYQTEDLGGQ